jgi:hypothetical protein
MRFYPVNLSTHTSIGQWADGNYPYLQLHTNMKNARKMAFVVFMQAPNGRGTLGDTRVTGTSLSLGIIKNDAWNTVTIQITLGVNGRVRVSLNCAPAVEYKGQTVWDKVKPLDPNFKLGVYGSGTAYFDDVVAQEGQHQVGCRPHNPKGSPGSTSRSGAAAD